MSVDQLLEALDACDFKLPVEIRVSRATVQRAPGEPAALTAMSVRQEEDRVVVETMLLLEAPQVNGTPAKEAAKVP